MANFEAKIIKIEDTRHLAAALYLFLKMKVGIFCPCYWD